MQLFCDCNEMSQSTVFTCASHSKELVSTKSTEPVQISKEKKTQVNITDKSHNFNTVDNRDLDLVRSTSQQIEIIFAYIVFIMNETN